MEVLYLFEKTRIPVGLLHGIHQGYAGVILVVELIEAFTGEYKGRYLPIIKADTGEVAAAGQQVGRRKISVVS